MKRKVLILTMVMVFVTSLFLNLHIVNADNEINDLDNSTANIVNETLNINSVNTNDNNMVEEITDDVKVKATANESTSEDWTDFSNAKFELKRNGTTAIVEVKGVTPKEYHTYFVFITSNSNQPDNIPEYSVTSGTSEFSKNGISLVYDKEKGVLRTYGLPEQFEFYEKNQDIYASIVDVSFASGGSLLVSYGNKLTRISESKYNDAFSHTFASNKNTQIVTNFIHSKNINRKMQTKIGKISDKKILQKIKEENISGFEELLDYARLDSGCGNRIVNCDEQSDIGCGSYAGNGNFSFSDIEIGEYYYLYVKTDDENGKYISNDAVTFGLSSSTYDGRMEYYFLW